jgi:hypothetical protein
VSDAARRFIKEPGAEDAAHYARRVRLLALWYVSLFVLATLGVGLLVWRAQLFVALTQRSNVETLTLAFLLVFFVYLMVLSARGVWGALHIVRLSVGGSWTDQQQRKLRALGGPSRTPTVVDLNVVLEQEGHPGEAWQVDVADRVSHMGRLEVDGARLRYFADHRDGSNEVLAYVEMQINSILGRTGTDGEVNIVVWKKIDDEDAERYHGMVEFARNLEREFSKGALWPAVRLAPQDIVELERRLSEICPALRNEGFLPNWDFTAEHKLPIVPEPLGLISLSRTYTRVDPVSSMGCALAVVAAVVVILALFILVPPWVPGI